MANANVLNTVTTRIALFFVFLVSTTFAADKKLIEFGWDIPTPAFLREHVKQMEQRPFDGCVFEMPYSTAMEAKGVRTGKLSSAAWGAHRFEVADFAAARADLEAITFTRFTDNFLRLNVQPGIDWFDDYSAVVEDFRLAGELAREGHAVGILLDTETYERKLFDFRKRAHQDRTWEEYSKQAQLRGEEIMRALQTAYPKVTVLLTFGYSMPWAQARTQNAPLADCSYGLLAPFLDGMLKVAGPGVTIVDGHEQSYGATERKQFEKARNKITRDVLPVVASPEAYAAHVRVGFGLWLDNNSHSRPWSSTHPETNYYTPEKFGSVVHDALELSDQYVWIYAERPRWWSETGEPADLPVRYQEALRRAELPQ
jgi:hypothetical protein